MLKDSKRFPDTNGWGYATIRYDASSDTFKPFGDSPAFAHAVSRVPYGDESARLRLDELPETVNARRGDRGDIR